MSFEKSVYSFIKELFQFDYETESIDHIWNVIFPNHKGKWHYLRVNQYQDIYYISLIDSDFISLEVKLQKSVGLKEHFARSTHDRHRGDPFVVWHTLITDASCWLKKVNKSWIKANRQAQEEYPFNRRMGVVPNALIRALLPDIYRIDQVLGKTKLKKFILLVETGRLEYEKSTIKGGMTANDFFEYCKIAYLASESKNSTINKNLSGREMYQSYADGRHEGLLDIDPSSKKEFADWLDQKHPKRTTGGHPWEIKRGGNTTHIDLYVSRPAYSLDEDFQLTLHGPSIGRLAETISMFLAIHEAGLPINIANAKDIRKRLLAQDNIGIVPNYYSLHRANQHFSKNQCVFDILHFDDLGRYKTQIKPFIIWDALPILKPKTI